MNKTLLLTAFIGVSAMAVAQNGRVYQNLRSLKADGHANSDGLVGTTAQTPAARGTAFWSQDFSGGSIPAGWTNVDVGTTGATPPVTFVWSNDPAAVAPAALGYQPSSTFNATTASNGYLWANSDRGLPAAPPTNHITRLTTTAINCSGQPTVQLTFNALIGVFDLAARDYAVIRVSTDLNNWTTYTAFPCLVTGAAAPPCSRWSANPQEVVIDISPTAANQSSVYIQWQWEGGWEYFYAIDDVQLSSLPDYERKLENVYMSHVGEGLEYHRIPQAQLGPDFILGAEVTNQGALPQTNLVISATVTGPASFSASTNVGTLNPGETATMEETAALPASMPVGEYTVTFSVSSDQNALENNPANDTFVRKFRIDNDKYALDGIGVHPAAIANTTSLGSNSFIDGEDGLHLLTFFAIDVPTQVYGLEALLANPGTSANAQVIMAIHTTANIDADNVNAPVAETDFITISAANISAGTVTGGFLGGPVTLQPGGYYAGIALYSNGGAAHVRVLDDIAVIQPGGAGLIYYPAGADAGIYGNGNAHAIRLGLSPSIGIEERKLDNVSMYPNPTNGVLWINTGDNANYEVEVRNLLGGLVFTTRFAGTSSIDLNDLARGVYTVRVSNDKGSAVSRITLK